MRILTVIYEFPPIGGGGGRAAYDICKELVARGHDVTVLTAHLQGLLKDEIQDGIRVVRISSFRTEPFVASFWAMLAYILIGFSAGLRLIFFHRPQVIHTHFAVPSGALAWMLSVLTGIPYILTAHLGDVPDGVPEKTSKWFRWLEPFTKPIWKRAKQVVAVSEFTRQLALKHYDVQIRVVPNGADVLHLIPDPFEVHQPPRFVFAGRFVSQKNPLAIVRILSQMKDLNWTCAMMGDGPMFDEVCQEIEKHQMLERFYLPGWVIPEDVLHEFSKSDILLMPSFSEGLPVVGVQALAKGLGVVASHIGGFIDLVDHEKNGYLIEVDDEIAFVSSLRTLITNPMQLKAFRQASLIKAQSFDIQKVAAAYEQMMQNVVNGK